MSQFDYLGMRDTADELIKFFGMTANLRRDGFADRPCVVAIYDYLPRDKETKLALPIERRVFLSAKTPEVIAMPPDYELDSLVTFVQPPAAVPVINEILNFAHPAKVYGPAGIVVAYDLMVRR